MPNDSREQAKPATENRSSSAGKPGLENEGEGNKTAARRYNKATEEYAHSGRVDEAANEAKQALESDEGEELREAEVDVATRQLEDERRARESASRH